MPLSASVDRSFAGGVVGNVVPTPSGVTLNGTQPTYVDNGSGVTYGRFNPASGTASYWRETITTVDSDFGQLTVDFVLRSAPTSNTECFLLAGSGAILTSALITTSRTLLMRDASASAQITGWTAPTLALDTPYRIQQAIIRGSSTTTGSIKAQLVRLSDGAILASGLVDANGNAGSVQCNGALVGKRTAAGATSLDIISYRVSNQAFDYLGDIPPSSGGTSFVPGADSLLVIGDSTTDRSGSGAAQVKASIVNNGQGWTNTTVLVNGLTGRTIAFDNGVHPTGLEQVDVFRNAGQDSRYWLIMLGGNGSASNLAQQQTWINQMTSKIAGGGRTDYIIFLSGFARQDPANADAARFWQAIQNVTAPTNTTLIKNDYNSAIHNGRDETGLWQSTSPTEAHMTPTGYALRDSLISPIVVKQSSTTPPTTKTPQVAAGDPVVYSATATSSVVTSPNNPTGPSGTWSTVFVDEFTGTSLDTTKWVNLDGYSMNSVTARASNVSVSGGSAKLQLSTNTDGAYISTNRNSVTGEGYLLLPGHYAEARVLFPGDGTQVYNWSAWWASGANWPTNGEHDIAEALGAGVLNHVYHGGTSTNRVDLGPYAIPGGYLGGSYHVFGVHRKATTSDFYVDGVLTRTITTSDLGGGQSLLLNVGYADPNFGGKNQTGSAGAMQVDYVKAWAPNKTPQVSIGDPATYVAVASGVVKTPQVSVGDPVVYTAASGGTVKTPQVSIGDPATYTATGTSAPAKTPQVSVGLPVDYTATGASVPAKTPQVSVGSPVTYAAAQSTVAPSGFKGWGLQLILDTSAVVTPPVTTPSTGVYSDTYSDTYDGATTSPSTPVASNAAWDYSASNVPWMDTPDTSSWPSDLVVVPLQTGSSDFYTNLSNTLNATSASRAVVQLPAGDYVLNSFRLIGSSGDPTYSFGFWFPKLQGFKGAGADKTFVTMAANSMSQAQLDKMQTMQSADFAPLQMGLCRIDGTTASPGYVSGLTFRADKQQDLTTKPSSTDWYNAVVPQSAPHQGVVLFGAQFYVSDVRFQGAGRALTGAPPFEMANVTSQKATITYLRCEFDGRRSSALDSTQPKVCGPIMLNNEVFSELRRCWGHDCNLSRYAANDENGATPGLYRLIETKFEKISTDDNNGLGGTNSQPSVLGFESSAARIELTDVILCQDNSNTRGTQAFHVSLTVTGANRQGGRLYVTRGDFRNSAYPTMDKYLSLRIPGSSVYWNADGHSTTIDVRNASGTRLTDYNTTTYPLSAAAQSSASISPSTHYIVRT